MLEGLDDDDELEPLVDVAPAVDPAVVVREVVDPVGRFAPDPDSDVVELDEPPAIELAPPWDGFGESDPVPLPEPPPDESPGVPPVKRAMGSFFLINHPKPSSINKPQIIGPISIRHRRFRP